MTRRFIFVAFWLATASVALGQNVRQPLWKRPDRVLSPEKRAA